MNGTSRSPSSRLVVIGIDAASGDLVDRWVADGELPNLQRLFGRGAYARTKGLRGFFVGATWPSMYTGASPANHGIHYLTQLVPGTYKLHYPADHAFVQRPAFWRALSDAGKRVAILDVPLTRLDTELNGLQTVEWGGHDSLYGFQTHPAELSSEILERYGRHPVGSSCDGDRQSAADFLSFVERLEEGVRTKTAITCELLARGQWDFFMQVFTEAHCMGHQCWHLHDIQHPAHDAAIARTLGNPLKRVYRTIDDAIGKIVEAAGDATIVVFSAHDMSYWYGAPFLLPDILFKLGVAVPRPRTRPNAAARLRAAAGPAWRLLPEAVRRQIRKVRATTSPPAKAASKPPTIKADPARSRCFPHPNGMAVGGIRLNIAGREPDGLLQPGEECEAFIARLTDQLLAIVDARTGKPLISNVLRTRDLYNGDHEDVLPDLLIEWNDAVPTGSTRVANGAGARVQVTSRNFGVLAGSNEYARTGEHRADGWIVAAGPVIQPGPIAEEVSLIDLAPTFTAMLGIQLPNCDGKPVDALVRASRP